jgi:hypothetical protein
MSWELYKADGSIQCSQKPGATPDEMRPELAEIVGDQNILGQRKAQLPGFHVQLCGVATDSVNVFKVTDEAFDLLFGKPGGIIGKGGFRPWIELGPDIDPGFNPVHHLLGHKPKPDAMIENPTNSAQTAHGPKVASTAADGDEARGGPEVPFPLNVAALARLTSANQNPTLVRELIGQRLMTIRPGDPVTAEYVFNRVNVIVNDANVIEGIYFY